MSDQGETKVEEKVEEKAVKMVKQTLMNTGFHTRRWDSLQRLEDRLDEDDQTIAQAGSTLELDPGESALVSVPEDFVDPWLKEAKVGASKKDNSKKEKPKSEKTEV